MKNNTIIIIFILIFSSIFSITFEEPNYFFSRFNMYASIDGIETYTNFRLYYSTRKLNLDFFSDPQFVVNVDFSYNNKGNNEHIYYIDFVNLDIIFDNFKINISPNTIKFFPEFIRPNLFVYYKDLGRPNWPVDLTNFDNEKFELSTFINNDEFGLGINERNTTFNLDLEISYNNRTIERLGRFKSNNDKNTYDVFEEGYKYEITDDGTLLIIKEFYYDNLDRIPNTKLNLINQHFKYDLNFRVNSGFFRGLRGTSELTRNINQLPLFEDIFLESEYYKKITYYDKITNQSTIIIYDKEKDNVVYQIPVDFEIEERNYFVHDIYYRRNFILQPGNILIPHSNLYIRDMNFPILTRGYDHYLRQRYEFKGINQFNASSFNLGVDWIYVKNNLTFYIFDNLFFRFDDEIKTAFYLNMNARYRMEGNNILLLDLKTFMKKDDINITFSPELNLRKDMFRLNLSSFFDYEIKEEFNFDFRDIVNSFEIEAFIYKSDIKAGVKIFNSSYRRFSTSSPAIFRNFYEKSDSLNWYLFFEFSKYFGEQQREQVQEYL